MQERSRNRRPVPQVQAFVVCREIWSNPRTGEFMLAAPISHIPIPVFPADIRVSVYAHITNGHGSYPIEFVLKTMNDELVWSWRPAALLDHPDPLVPHQLVFHDLMLGVPSFGRYDFALLADGEEIAHQPLLIGQGEYFRSQ